MKKGKLYSMAVLRHNEETGTTVAVGPKICVAQDEGIAEKLAVIEAKEQGCPAEEMEVLVRPF